MSNVDCKSCVHSVVSFLALSEEQLRDFLIKHGVIRKSVECPSCGSQCTLTKCQQYWRCQRKRVVIKGKKKMSLQCNAFLSIRNNSFFSKSKLDIPTICRFSFLYICTHSPRIEFLQHEFNLARQTVIDWVNFLREVMMDWALKNDGGSQLGGVGKVVEIDESKMGKRMYNRGRIVEGQWVFGGIERDSGRMFIVCVDSRDKETLLNVIKERIAPGTKIISDGWASYACLEDEGYEHEVVNHSENFVDPLTGAHTQNIERSWRTLKSNVPRFGRQKSHFDGYLAEFLFVRRFPNHVNRAHQLFCAIANLYDPYKSDVTVPQASEEVKENNAK